MHVQYKNLEIERLNHAAFKIKGGGKVIYFDPFKIPAGDIEKADIVFVSHEHFDHCSPDDLKKIVGAETVVVAISACKDNLSGLDVKEIKYVKPGDGLEIQGIKIEVVPAYNLNKFRSPGVPFHPKEDGKVGFIVEIDGTRIYHAGDTDGIPEMENLQNIDVALLPISGIYVMTVEEAVAAAEVIKPKLVVPMHYGDIVGTSEDAQRFKELSSVSVEII